MKRAGTAEVVRKDQLSDDVPTYNEGLVTRYEAISVEKCCLIDPHGQHVAYDWSSCFVAESIGKGWEGLDGIHFLYNPGIHEGPHLTADCCYYLKRVTGG